jgi:hypothetical protein
MSKMEIQCSVSRNCFVSTYSLFVVLVRALFEAMYRLTGTLTSKDTGTLVWYSGNSTEVMFSKVEGISPRIQLEFVNAGEKRESWLGFIPGSEGFVTLRGGLTI